jgi:hypothetical protein
MHPRRLFIPNGHKRAGVVVSEDVHQGSAFLFLFPIFPLK